MNKLITLALLFIPLLGNAQSNTNNNLDKKVENLIKQLTLEEKIALCVGRDNWTTQPVERLGIPSIWMTDGPSGLRKSKNSAEFAPYIPATSFPAPATMASSWDINLIKKQAKIIGEECQANQVQILLAPGINIKRTPLCGRNFEFYSEDPILSGEFGSAFISGIQSQGVGTCLKHYACSNQEILNVEVDDRTLREIYLRAFEYAIEKAKPWSIMPSYKRVNGIYSTEHAYLIDTIARKEWGFKGIGISDWWAVHDKPACIKAGLNLEMPGGDSIAEVHYNNVVEALDKGELKESEIDRILVDLLKTIFKADAHKRTYVTYNQEEHHKLAREIASECVVLLKNEDNILPLDKKRFKKIAVIGSYAKNDTLINGSGSARLIPTMVDIPYEEIKKLGENDFKFSYAQGYPVKYLGENMWVEKLGIDTFSNELFTEAVEHAKTVDLVIIYAGLGLALDKEIDDKENLDMPPAQLKLIEAISSIHENVIVVLNNGSPIVMPWLPKVKAVVLNGLNGQAAGGAIADVLFGVVNPSGRLAETYPMRLEDNPAYINPGENKTVRYGEGVFVGYRYYEKRNIEPLFPFGYGLSYTTFEYSDLKLSANQIKHTDSLEVKFKVKNTGNVEGKEVAQLYVGDLKSTYHRPLKELKAFTKIALKPGEEKEITFKLGYRDFAYYNPSLKKWTFETGDFKISVGASSSDIKLKEIVNIEIPEEEKK